MLVVEASCCCAGSQWVVTQKRMADSQVPLLERNFYEGCPGCLLERSKLENKGPPRKKLCFVALMVLCNALPISSLFPFIYFMVQSFGIAKAVTKIGTYAGFIGSAFMLGRFMTSTPWGIFADRYGRKPVMLIGTFSIVVFNTIFGFSKNFWLALVSRFLLGFCNGTLGAVRAYASEVCREEHQAVGLSMVGTMWGVGLIIGPAIGGYLAQPSEKYPGLFPSGSLFDTFPYALPCLCISVFALLGLVAGFFLPETLHKHPTALKTNLEKKASKDLENRSNGDKTDNPEDDAVEARKVETTVLKSPLWKNWAMVAAISVYCLWGLHDMAYSEIFSLWAVSSVTYGGLGFTTSEVGDVLAGAGAALLLFQLFLFPRLAKRFGAIQMARVPAILTLPVVALYPLMSRLSGAALWTSLLSAAVIKNVLSICIVTGSFLMINNSVVIAQRGVANGISMTFMSLFKAIGPTLAGVLFSWAQERIDAAFLPGMWSVFCILDIFCLIAVVATFEPILPRSVNHPINEMQITSADETLERVASFSFD